MSLQISRCIPKKSAEIAFMEYFLLGNWAEKSALHIIFPIFRRSPAKTFCLAKTPAFISLKDHKPNFMCSYPCHLTKPCKSELGKISKTISGKTQIVALINCGKLRQSWNLQISQTLYFISLAKIHWQKQLWFILRWQSNFFLLKNTNGQKIEKLVIKKLQRCCL